MRKYITRFWRKAGDFLEQERRYREGQIKDEIRRTLPRGQWGFEWKRLKKEDHLYPALIGLHHEVNDLYWKSLKKGIRKSLQKVDKLPPGL